MSVLLFINLVFCLRDAFFFAVCMFLIVSNSASWSDRAFIRGDVIDDLSLLSSKNILSLAVLDLFCNPVAKFTV